jgi:hypothetical protein
MSTSDTDGKSDADQSQQRDLSLENWVRQLYSVDSYEAKIEDWYDAYKYQGFDRDEVLSEMKNLRLSIHEMAQIILICALHGPVRSADKQLKDGRTIRELGIPERRKPGAKGLSTSRIVAATADLAAFYLKKVNFPKRVKCACPGWLQFPSAGSIKLPQAYRDQHKEFSKMFSDLIKGEFNEQIYEQMEANSYYDPTLGLF